jgi:hypothetical protein
MSSKKTNYFLQAISALFIFLFVYTALSKFREFARFVFVLGKSPLIGAANHVIAWAIPLAELAVSLLLLLSSTKRTGMYGALILMSLFTAYVAYMILFVPHLPCSCGGVIQQLNWRQHLVLNISLTVLAAIAAFPHKIFVATDRGNRKPVTE